MEFGINPGESICVLDPINSCPNVGCPSDTAEVLRWRPMVSSAGAITRLLHAVRRAREQTPDDAHAPATNARPCATTPHETEAAATDAQARDLPPNDADAPPNNARASSTPPEDTEAAVIDAHARELQPNDETTTASDAKARATLPGDVAEGERVPEGEDDREATARRSRKRRRRRRPPRRSSTLETTRYDGGGASPRLRSRTRLAESGTGSAIHPGMDVVESCPEAAGGAAPELPPPSLEVPVGVATANEECLTVEALEPYVGHVRRWDVNWLLCGDGRTLQGAAFKRGVVYFTHFVNVRAWGDFSPIFWDNGIFVDLPARGTCFNAQYRGPHMSLLDTLQCVIPPVHKQPGVAPTSKDVRRH